MNVISSKQKGFTLVELLIVIVVIAVLAAISIVAYNGIQERARDSQRRSDVAVIQKALEMYHLDNGGYPACSSTPYQPGGVRGSCYTSNSGIMSALSPKYINSLPVDPINDTAYRYRYIYGSKKSDDVTYRASADDNYILAVGYESQGGPYATQVGGVDSKYNMIYGSDR